MKHYYTTLEVSPHASGDEIQTAFRALAKKYHPDSNSPFASATKFQAVLEAYDVLSDPDKRRKYDLDCTVLDQIDIFQAFAKARDAAIQKNGGYLYSGRRGGGHFNSQIAKIQHSNNAKRASTWTQAKRKVGSLIKTLSSALN